MGRIVLENVPVKLLRCFELTGVMMCLGPGNGFRVDGHDNLLQ
jgi:hypothetical protein